MNTYKYMIVVGNPSEGFEYYGPFDSRTDAVEWASDDCEGADWWVIPIKHPNNNE